MKMMKGLMLGTLLTVGTMMYFSEGVDINKKKMIRKGRQMAKRMGIYL